MYCTCAPSHHLYPTNTTTPHSALEPYGWTERYVPQQTQYTLTREEAEELTNLLGIEGDDTHLSTAGASGLVGGEDENDPLPYATHERLLRERGTDVVVVELGGGVEDQAGVVFVVWDGSMVDGHALQLVQGLGQRTVVVNIEQLQCMDRNQIHTLAGVVVRRVLTMQQEGPFVMAGVGSGAALAYDTCLALQEVEAFCVGGNSWKEVVYKFAHNSTHNSAHRRGILCLGAS